MIPDNFVVTEEMLNDRPSNLLAEIEALHLEAYYKAQFDKTAALYGEVAARQFWC